MMYVEVKDCRNCKYDYTPTGEEPCKNCKHDGRFGEDDAPLLWESKEDVVNHPSHYETGKFECIDVMTEAIGLEKVKGFCVCNAFKYIYRCTKKHETPVEDVKKAVWYLKKFLELEGALDE